MIRRKIRMLKYNNPEASLLFDIYFVKSRKILQTGARREIFFGKNPIPDPQGHVRNVKCEMKNPTPGTSPKINPTPGPTPKREGRRSGRVRRKWCRGSRF
jgi:hypothetical protein